MFNIHIITSSYLLSTLEQFIWPFRELLSWLFIKKRLSYKRKKNVYLYCSLSCTYQKYSSIQTVLGIDTDRLRFSHHPTNNYSVVHIHGFCITFHCPCFSCRIDSESVFPESAPLWPLQSHCSNLLFHAVEYGGIGVWLLVSECFVWSKVIVWRHEGA